MKSITITILLIFIYTQVALAQGDDIATSPMTYDAIGFSDRSPFLKIRQDGLQRYLHPGSLRLVDEIEESSGGLFVVIVDGAYGVLDSEGKLIADFIYDETLLKTEYKGQWHEGISYHYKFVLTKLAGKFGLIDALGNEIVSPQYDEMRILDSLTIAFRQNGKWGWLDVRTGDVLQTAIYEDATKSYVLPGAVGIELNKKEGLADRDGRILVAPEYRYLRSFALPGQDWILFSDGVHQGLLDRVGKLVLPAEFTELHAISDPNVVKYKKNGIGFWNIKEQRAILEGYEAIENAVEGNSIVIKEGKQGVVNIQGQVLIKPEYDRISFMNVKGALQMSYSEIVTLPVGEGFSSTKPQKEQRLELSRHFIYVSKGRKQGVFDWEGKEIIPIAYQQIFPVYKQGKTYFQVYQEELYALFDGQGEQLSPFEYQNNAYLNNNYYPQSSAFAEDHIIPLSKNEGIGLYHAGLEKVTLTAQHEFIEWNEFDQMNVRRTVEDNRYSTEKALLDATGTIIRPYAEDVSYAAVAADRIVETRMVDGRWRNRLVDLAGKTLYENDAWEEFKSKSLTKLLLPENANLNVTYQNELLKIDGKEDHLFIDREGVEKRFDNYAFVGNFYDDRAVAMAYATPLKADETMGSMREKERFGIIDSQGNVLLPVVYERMENSYAVPDLLKVKRDGKWGLVTKQGKVVMETVYDDINFPSTFSSSNKPYVDIVQDGKSGIALRDGTIVVPPIYERIHKNYNSYNAEIAFFMVFDGEWYHLMDSQKGLLPIKAKKLLN